MSTTDKKRELINKIILAYHTTRMTSTPVADHILSKGYVNAAFDELFDEPEETTEEQLDFDFFFWLNEDHLQSLSEEEFMQTLEQKEQERRDWLEVNI